jgi:hypothetical protein
VPQNYDGPATFVVGDAAYRIQHLVIRMTDTDDSAEPLNEIEGVEGVPEPTITVYESELPETALGLGELRLDDGQVLAADWGGQDFVL